MIQQLIWKQLYRMKTHAVYLELLLAQTETIDRAIKIFLAIVSSGSIAGWVVWKEAQFVWGFLIAASQVVNAIRPYLPYKERMKALSALARELDELAIHTEIKWLEIAAGELTEKEMRKLHADMLTKASGAAQKHFPNNAIPSKPALLNQAETTATKYLESHVNGESQ